MQPPQDLIDAAMVARQQAYAPYSHFLVGAALRAGRLGTNAPPTLFSGCNVENQSYGLTICAERAAVTSAVTAGCRHLLELAVVTQGGVTPCGACRQVLAEFNPDLVIWLIDMDHPEIIPPALRLTELLPYRFMLDLRDRH